MESPQYNKGDTNRWLETTDSARQQFNRLSDYGVNSTTKARVPSFTVRVARNARQITIKTDFAHARLRRLLEFLLDPHAQPQHVALQLRELPTNLLRFRLLKLGRANLFNGQLGRFDPEFETL